MPAKTTRSGKKVEEPVPEPTTPSTRSGRTRSGAVKSPSPQPSPTRSTRGNKKKADEVEVTNPPKKQAKKDEDAGISPALLQAVQEVSKTPGSPSKRKTRRSHPDDEEEKKDNGAAPAEEPEKLSRRKRGDSKSPEKPPMVPQEAPVPAEDTIEETVVETEVAVETEADVPQGEEVPIDPTVDAGQFDQQIFVTSDGQQIQGQTLVVATEGDNPQQIPLTITPDGQIFSSLPSQLTRIDGQSVLIVYCQDGQELQIPTEQLGLIDGPMDGQTDEGLQQHQVADATSNLTAAAPSSQHPHDGGMNAPSAMAAAGGPVSMHPPDAGANAGNVHDSQMMSEYAHQGGVQHCPICGDSNSGYHYGIYSCESCKGFFKRAIQNNRQLRCNFSGNCDVTPITRKRCAACRLRKCLLAGMKVEAIRADRRRGGRSIYISSPPAPHYRPMRFMKTKTGLKAYRSDQLLQAEAQRLLHEVMCMENQLADENETESCCVRMLTESDQDPAASLLHLAEHRLYRLIHWARQLPNFSAIETNDQIVLLQSCWASLLALCMCFQSVGNDAVVLNYGKTVSRQTADRLDLAEVFCRIQNVASFFAGVGLSREEYVSLRLLLLVNPDVDALAERDKTREYQEQFSDMLMFHCITFRTLETHRYGSLLLRLPEVAHIGHQIREWMLKTYDGCNDANRPQLTGLLVELLKQQQEQQPVMSRGTRGDVLDGAAGGGVDGRQSSVTAVTLDSTHDVGQGRGVAGPDDEEEADRQPQLLVDAGDLTGTTGRPHHGNVRQHHMEEQANVVEAEVIVEEDGSFMAAAPTTTATAQ